MNANETPAEYRRRHDEYREARTAATGQRYVTIGHPDYPTYLRTNCWPRGTSVKKLMFFGGDELGLLVSPDGVPDDWEGPVPKVIHVFGVEIVTDSELDTTQ